MMNRRTLSGPPETAPGHVTVVVIRRLDPSELLQDEDTTLAVKQSALNLSPRLKKKIERFLDKRRLITTRVHIEAPQLREVGVTMKVIVSPDRSVTETESLLRRRLHEFISVKTGLCDGTGWPPGRDVYRSDIYRLAEGTEGVEHVSSLALTPANAPGDVELAQNELPVFQITFVSQ